MSKHFQMEEYKERMSNLTERQLRGEIKSYRKHLQSHHDYYQWGRLNPEDMNNADRLLVLLTILKERGLEE